MQITCEGHWENFVTQAVSGGLFPSATDVVHEGLRLVEERQAKLKWLQDTVNASIARGGAYTSEDVMRKIKERGEQLRREGVAK